MLQRMVDTGNARKDLKEVGFLAGATSEVRVDRCTIASRLSCISAASALQTFGARVPVRYGISIARAQA